MSYDDVTLITSVPVFLIGFAVTWWLLKYLFGDDR